jgi:hypothetical protein
MGQLNTPAIWARLHRYFDAVPAVTTFTFVSDDLAGFFSILFLKKDQWTLSIS